jgi:hypothetical protein
MKPTFTERLTDLIELAIFLPLFLLLIQLSALSAQLKRVFYIIFRIPHIKVDDKFHSYYVRKHK